MFEYVLVNYGSKIRTSRSFCFPLRVSFEEIQFQPRMPHENNFLHTDDVELSFEDP